MRKFSAAIAGIGLFILGDYALAADMPVKAPQIVAPAPVYNWSGFYAGLGLGFRNIDVDGNINSATNNGVPIGNASASCPTPSPSCPGLSFNETAFRVSGYLGYNWQFAPQWVAGIEGDFGWADNKKTTAGALYPGGAFPFYLTGRADDAFGIKADWDASLRLRLGYLVTPAVLIYGTGGVAWQNLKATSTCGPSASCFPGQFGPGIIEDSSVRTGWTVGGGLEWMFAPNWIVRGEYRYADFGTVTNVDTHTCPAGACAVFPGLPAVTQVTSYDLDMKTHTVTFGLAYKFGR